MPYPNNLRFVEIEALDAVTDEVVAALNRLLPQLSSTAPPLDSAALRRILAAEGITVLVARLDGAIVAALALSVSAALTAVRARIEDLVVDEAARGRGIGAALTREAIRLARAAGATPVLLTSRPSRVAAGRLYERMGFRIVNTRVFRLD
jgi:ribosomal protein S18 acetylase RimI-like enzyme